MKLDAYSAWTPTTPPVDPRTGDLAAITSAFREMVASEGPMLLSLAIRRYIQATPDLSRAGAAIRGTFRTAVDRLSATGELLTHNELGLDDEHHLLLAVPDQPLLPRQRADRSLQEIPMSELAAMMLLVRSARGVSNYTETVQRGVLNALELIRLTGTTKERLLTAWHVAGRWIDEGNAPARPARIETRELDDVPAARAAKAAKPAPDPDVPPWQAALRGTPFSSR